MERLEISPEVFVDSNDVLNLINNVKSLSEQRDEMITDITGILTAILEIGEKFQDKSKLMSLITQLPRLMMSKDPKAINSLIPMHSFQQFAVKYGPVCFPEVVIEQTQIAENHGR